MSEARVPLFPDYQIPAFRFVDIFAGIGGMRLGFEAVGRQCVFSSEWDVHSQKTYFANHGDFPQGDVTLIPSSEIPNFDVLLAGFPCQPNGNSVYVVVNLFWHSGQTPNFSRTNFELALIIDHADDDSNDNKWNPNAKTKNT